MLDSSYFCVKSHFEDDGAQNYLVPHPIYRNFKIIGNSVPISAWKSKGLFNESIKALLHLIIVLLFHLTILVLEQE